MMLFGFWTSQGPFARWRHERQKDYATGIRYIFSKWPLKDESSVVDDPIDKSSFVDDPMDTDEDHWAYHPDHRSTSEPFGRLPLPDQRKVQQRFKAQQNQRFRSKHHKRLRPEQRK
jgi:hypothetical protein